MKNILATAALIFTPAFSAQAADITVDMLNKRDDGAKMVYSQDVVRMDVGDSVTWVPTSKGHNVEIIAAPDGYDIPKKSKLSKDVSITFDTPGVYLYQCTPHKTMGMLGVVVVGDGQNDISGAKVRGKKAQEKLAELMEQLG
ncbi:plastocyanin/azurin family copper-binding protein [Candidatus Salinivivens marinus]|uniref:plastocyanin/azurin family copper-binding protein n=1 Tax=Candidatus Salinivivens marinus TaxID=3381703 RepID=UPI000BDFEBEE|nr:MAG: pseudoazurin [Rhodobacteraceae bacterium MED-G08]|tara:strand:+ start:371 stop:796 length:426 start_codon:yes stop_codon:yes gene_type:complete